MKSKNVKSVSYAEGPKQPLFKNCSIMGNALDWPAASSHSLQDFFFYDCSWLLIETCRPQRRPCMDLILTGQQLIFHAWHSGFITLSRFMLVVNKCLKFSAPRQPQFSKSRTNFNLCIKQTETYASEAVHSCKAGYILKL